MLSREARTRRRDERRAFREYLKNPGDAPFILKRREEYCVCRVIFPSIFSEIGLAIRSVTAWLVSVVPCSILKVVLCRLMGAKVGREVFISPGVVIDPFYPWLIQIGDGCFLGMGCRLFAHEYTATDFRVGRIRIGNGSVIGAYSTVRSGVTVGERVTVGFNSYVNRDVPDGVTVGGVPAKPLSNGEVNA